MPAAFGTLPRSISEFFALVHTVHLYGAAGITAFGWGVGHMLGWATQPWLPLWFCAALVIYNADRIRPDPADAVNVPERTAAARRWRSWSEVICGLAAAVLIFLPLYRHDWLTLGLVLGGAFVCLHYSIPIFGFRWKDVPLLKTFFAPTIVTAAVLGLPWLHVGPATDLLTLTLSVFRAWAFLMFNMILCDLRDVVGDRASGVRSLPVALGEKNTRRLLLGMLVLLEILSLMVLQTTPNQHYRTWVLICVLGPIYLGSLLFAIRQHRSERFYEWAVEGMLFLPTIVVLVTR